MWDDCKGLLKEGSDDARSDPRMLCCLQDSRRVNAERASLHVLYAVANTCVFANTS